MIRALFTTLDKEFDLPQRADLRRQLAAAANGVLPRPLGRRRRKATDVANPGA